MVILTGKGLERLKRDIKNDLRREMVKEASSMIVDMFDYILGEHAVSPDGEAREGHPAIQFGSGSVDSGDKVYILLGISARNITRMIDHKVKAEYSGQIAEQVTAFVNEEAFIDHVISRINRKQLVGGK